MALPRLRPRSLPLAASHPGVDVPYAGLTTSRRPLADVVNAARAAAGRTVGLIDASKFGRASLVSIAPAQELDVIVTDDGLEETVADEYRAAGVRLEIVNA